MTHQERLSWLRNLASSVISEDPRPEWLIKYASSLKKRASGLIPEEAIYYRFLYALARILKPKNMLEIGTLYGWSTIHLAAGNPEGSVLSVDIDHEAGRCGSDLMGKFNIENVVFYTGDSLGPVPVRSPVHLLFIDGDHTYDHVKGELKKYVPMMEKFGVVLMDDICRDDGMRRAWNEIQIPKIESPMLHTGAWTGFGAFIIP